MPRPADKHKHIKLHACCGADKYDDPANELCEWETAKAIGRKKGKVTIITSDNLFCHI